MRIIPNSTIAHFDAEGRVTRLDDPGVSVEVDDATAEVMIAKGHARQADEDTPKTEAAKRSTRTRGADRETR